MSSTDVPDYIFEELDRVGQTDRKSILESDFIGHFLPMIRARDSDESFDIRSWVEIAGTPHSPINVIDDNSHELLFILPPVMARIGTFADPDVNVSDTIIRYGAMMENHDLAQADALLFRDLGGLIAGIDKDRLIESIRQWVPIYKRYDLDLTKLTGLTNLEPYREFFGDEVVEQLSNTSSQKTAEKEAEVVEQTNSIANGTLGSGVDF